MDFSKASEIVRKANVIALTNYKNQSSYLHACRVAEYVDANPMIRGYDKDCCIALALLHDLPHLAIVCRHLLSPHSLHMIKLMLQS